jgi:hypothetical protein
MKKVCVLLILAASIAGCKSSTGPASSNNITAVVPPDSSSFTYSYSSGILRIVQLTEGVTIIDTTASSFVAERVSDTVDSVFTTENDSYSLLPDGDLTLQPDTLPFPLTSHSRHNEEQSIPLKIGGEVGTGTIFSHTDYLGDESITAAGESFLCSKVTRTDSIITNFPSDDTLNNQRVTVTAFWYSAQLGYFVKEQCEESAGIGAPVLAMWARTLTSYKLGK